MCACLSVCQSCNLQETSMHPGPRQMNSETLDFSDEDDLSNVNVKSLVSFLSGRKRATIHRIINSPERSFRARELCSRVAPSQGAGNAQTRRVAARLPFLLDRPSKEFYARVQTPFLFSPFFFSSLFPRLDAIGEEKPVNVVPFPESFSANNVKFT